MAKRVTFLLVMMFVLLLASVTAFAAGTDSTTPDAGFTKEEANHLAKISISEVLEKYGQLFLDEDTVSDKQIISIGFERAYSLEHPLRYTFTGSAVDTSVDMDNPIVMLMYIKVDGKYVPLNDISTDKNITEELIVTDTVVDLKNLGSNKVNEIRIIAFRKNDSGRLQLDKNLQVTDLEITVRPWNFIEKVKITYNEIKNNLAP